MTEELKNAMRNATDEILMTVDKYNASKEDRKKLIDNLRIILVNQEAQTINHNKVAFVGSKMHSLLTDPEALKEYLATGKLKEKVKQ